LEAAENGGMARTSTRTPEEIERLVSSYQRSGMTRGQYCTKHGIAVSTLDYYRHRLRNAPKQSLVEVKLNDHECSPTKTHQSFTLVLAQGRRIETTWPCDKQQLTQLIRIVEAA
jgi:hypothetical protein